MHDNIPKIATETPNLALERQTNWRELFPEAWSEGELDFSKLRTPIRENRAIQMPSATPYYRGLQNANRKQLFKPNAKRHPAACAREIGSNDTHNKTT
jgi:hypothetical protein